MLKSNSHARDSLAKEPVYVVGADDEFRQSLQTLLSANGWRVTTFDSANTFIASSSELQSGLLMVDLSIVEKSDLAFLESGVPELDRFAIVLVTEAGGIQTAVRTTRAAAIHVIEKPFSADELFHCLHVLNSKLAEALHDRALTLDAKRRVESLSRRERDVLQRLLGGASYRLIAQALNVSPRTVETHRAKMLQRLGLASTAEALEIARRAEIEPVSCRAHEHVGS